MAGYPEPNFTHLLRLSDDVGTARGVTTNANPQWTDGPHLAVAWFLGDNDAKVSMVDDETGGGADGLNQQGRSESQRTESTLALLSTLQHGRRLDGSSRGR